MNRGLLVSAMAAGTLVGAYGGLGGASYRPVEPADHCLARPVRTQNGVAAAIEGITLSTIDGAACTLHSSREALVLALNDDANRQEFRAAYRVSDDQIDAAAHAALTRAIDDAQRAGSISGSVAGRLRSLTGRIPAGSLLPLVRGLIDLVS